MKNPFAILVLALAMPASTALAADDKMHPPEKAMDSATPKMKNPDGTEGMHPPQKAMDNAVPTEKMPKGEGSASTGESASTGASDGSSGASFPDWDIRKAGESVDLKAPKN